MTDPEIVGIIGFGELGAVAGAALKANGRRVLAVDPSARAREHMAELGVEAASGLADLGRRCSHVIVLVADADQTRATLTGPQAIFETMSAGVVILHSTVGPEVSREVARACPPGVAFIDAPVTVRRSTPQTFFALVGAAHEPGPSVRKLLDCYCHDVAYLGPVGAGQAVKLANNVMSLVNTAAAAEALRLAEAYGIDREAMIALAGKGSGASHALATWGAREALFEPGHDHGGHRKMAKKDLALALQSAEAVRLQMPLTTCAIRQIKA